MLFEPLTNNLTVENYGHVYYCKTATSPGNRLRSFVMCGCVCTVMVDTGVGMGPDMTSHILRLVVRSSACGSKAVMWSSDRFGTVKKNTRRPALRRQSPYQL